MLYKTYFFQEVITLAGGKVEVSKVVDGGPMLGSVVVPKLWLDQVGPQEGVGHERARKLANFDVVLDLQRDLRCGHKHIFFQ